MTKTNKFLSAALIAAVMACFAGYAVAMSETPKNEVIEIGGKNFVIPSGLKAGYDENAKAIRFIADARTLEIVRKGHSNPGMKDVIEVFVVEDGNKPYGEKNFWPNPLARTDYFDCKPYELADTEYEFCQYDRGQEAIHIWGQKLYVLREKGTVNPVLLLGCNDMQKAALPNPICEGKALLLGNIHVRYVYSIENFARALEIDQAIRQAITEFHNLTGETRNVVHTEPR